MWWSVQSLLIAETIVTCLLSRADTETDEVCKNTHFSVVLHKKKIVMLIKNLHSLSPPTVFLQDKHHNSQASQLAPKHKQASCGISAVPYIQV